ncbi:hypothetical protein [Acinetobacter sp. NIPH 2699]|uniref:hypothetical protein n=1 Tax=Acinetobacter sp. NIPH 2699 TaxID=2923433 RepID=UPI001F4AD2C7|nr:hypothetical protein [Acinetobacter sp. NIPH 2699]MCH7336114.1 hypothetical protein [Acinetobacter sp. NIPH 2699]
MNKLLSILFLSLVLIACNNQNNGIGITQSKNTQKESHSEVLKPLVTEFNAIMLKLQTEDDIAATQKKLEVLLSKFPDDNNASIQVQKLELKILLQLGYLDDAYILSTKILEVDNSASIKETQCLILRKTQKPLSQIQNCYENAAKLYQAQYEMLNKDEPNAQYALWGSYAAMYQAGHSEYQQRLKALVDVQQTEDSKLTYQNMYENVVDPDVMKGILEAMPYKPR